MNRADALVAYLSSSACWTFRVLESQRDSLGFFHWKDAGTIAAFLHLTEGTVNGHLTALHKVGAVSRSGGTLADCCWKARPAQKIDSRSPGLHSAIIHKSDSHSLSARLFGLPDAPQEQPILFSLSRFAEDKEVLDAFRAAPGAAKLDVRGQGREFAEVKELVEGLSPRGRIYIRAEGRLVESLIVTNAHDASGIGLALETLVSPL